MRPLEAGNTPRKVRALDRATGTGLSRHREAEEEFRDLLDEALDRRPRETDTPEPPADRVELGPEPEPAGGFDSIDRVEIGGRPGITPAEAGTAQAAAGPAQRHDSPAEDTGTGPEPTGTARDGRNRLDLKA